MLWVLIRSASAQHMFFYGENYPKIITKYSSLTSPLVPVFMVNTVTYVNSKTGNHVYSAYKTQWQQHGKVCYIFLVGVFSKYQRNKLGY